MTEKTELPLAADKPPVQTETVEQAEDKVLDALMGKDEKPEPVKAEAEPEKKITPVEAEDAPAEEDESADSDELEKAITSLRRAKVPQTVLKKMSQREIVAMSETLAARQAETDNAFRELGELRKKAAESQKESIAEPPSTDDLDAELAQYFDPETGKALKSVTARAIESHTKQLKTELASMSDLVERLLTKEIRGDLKDRFPEVEDAGKWDKVRAKAETLAKTGDYKGLEDPMRAVFEDACSLVLKQAPANPVKPKTDTSRLKENGQPATKSKQVPARALTPEERENAALDALLDGKGREAARTAYGG